ncbi:VolA/Pla-1 family phospholipase [Rheinheimera baltica]|uniref:VolA/Pla-1 family phospholipase n=1 Tax=Rheinheimera baltica TaxID=67576 RepID=UPI00040DCFF8|nr:VolA/Pla-1 family phospholipase [Rheinheimera baltica]
MNKLALSVAVTLALGLTGCGSESLDDIKTEVGENTVKPYSRVVFDPGASTPRLSVPNDLLFQGTMDGTLTLDAGPTPDYTNPQVALGALDGWSTQNPFTMAVDLAPGATLVASSVQQPGAVRLYEMVMQDPASAVDECQTPFRGFACQAVAELTFGQDFVTTVSGNNIVVVPLKPLKSATTYMSVLTSLIEDSNGQSIAPSTSYELVKQDDDALPLSTPSQISLQKLINSFEDAIEAEGVDRDSIIYTAAITTQSTTNVLATVKSLMAAPGSPYAPTSFGVQAVAPVSMIPGTPLTGNPSFDNVILYQGSVKLPYYLGAQTAEAPTAPLSTRWMAACDSGAILAQAPEGVIPESPVSVNDGLCAALSQGQLRDLGLDSARHLTKFNTIPKINSYETVPVLMTAPNAPTPATGWPVVMLTHGITSCKENMLAVTAALTQQGFATVAMDQPLHGDRGFAGINASGSGCGISNGNATVYMNLSNLLVTRDNLRQSVADILALRLALNSVQGISLDMSNVQLLGISLGSITGTSAVAIANSPSGNQMLDAAYSIKSAALTVPGGAVANFLLESASFGGLIKASVILGSPALQPGFVQYLATEGTPCPELIANPASFTGCAAQYVDAYVASLPGASNGAATLATIQATLAQFAFAAQTVTDSGDPNNYAQLLAVTETPVYIAEVIGDGINSSTSDRVIPNQTTGMPLGGTEPLARLLGATSIDTTAGPQALAGNVIARFTAGSHSSLLDPSSSVAATVEMQTHVASFLASKGTALVVANPGVLAPAN